MEQAAIVPDHRVSRRPLMVIDSRRLAGKIDQLLKQAFRFVGFEPGNVMRMTSDDQRLPSGLRMYLDQRPQRYGTVMESVAAVVAAFFWRMPQLRLAVVKRVMRGEALHSRAHRIVERVIGRPHVGPSGAST